MKKLVLSIILLLVFACGPVYQLSHNFNMYYTQEQVDSVCNVERIPKNLDKWDNMTMYDDSAVFNQYMYIKSNDSTQTVYTLTDLDSLYNFKKKTLKIIDKK